MQDGQRHDESLITKLLDETYAEVDCLRQDSEQSGNTPKDLGDYFDQKTEELHSLTTPTVTSPLEKKLLLGLTQQNILTITGHFISEIKCLRFPVQQYVLDVPINWSMFSTLMNELTHERQGVITLTSTNDLDYFISLFQEFYPGTNKIHFLTLNKKIYCLMLKNVCPLIDGMIRESFMEIAWPEQMIKAA